MNFYIAYLQHLLVTDISPEREKGERIGLLNRYGIHSILCNTEGFQLQIKKQNSIEPDAAVWMKSFLLYMKKQCNRLSAQSRLFQESRNFT